METAPEKITLTLDADKETVPALQPGDPSLAVGMIDTSMLSSEELEAVEQFANEIDVGSLEQVLSYGAAAQRNVSDVSANVLKKVRALDLEEVSVTLKKLMAALDAAIEPEEKCIPEDPSQHDKQAAETIAACCSKAEASVNAVEKDLLKHQVVLTQDIAMYQQMYELNLEYYKQLTMYVIAGKKALTAARAGRLAELRARMDAANRQEDAQAYRDFADRCRQFEKKLNDLEVTRMISEQTALQVRMLRDNDREMLNRIHSSLANTLPLWRNQLVISLGLERGRRALEAQQVISAKANDLLLKNAETLRMSAAETAREAERPIIDVKALRKCSRELITSINEVVKIHEQGFAQRERTCEELMKIGTERGRPCWRPAPDRRNP